MNAPRPRPQLVRQAPGNRFHLANCRTVKRRFATAWNWGNEHTAAEIVTAVVDTGVLPCKVCKPIRTLTEWERFARLEAARAAQ